MTELPPIGSSERETLETLVLDRARTLLIHHESIREALASTHREAIASGWSMRAAIDLADHVEQCWITAVLR